MIMTEKRVLYSAADSRIAVTASQFQIIFFRMVAGKQMTAGNVFIQFIRELSASYEHKSI
jgi:hypothetical protein